MSTRSNEEVVRRYYEDVLNEGRSDFIDETAVESYNEHDPLPGQGTGRDGLKERVTMLRVGLSPRFTLEDVVADGDKVVVRWTNNGTHVAEFLGIPATGKGFEIPGIDIHRLEHGKLAEHWPSVDHCSMLHHFCLIPPCGHDEPFARRRDDVLLVGRGDLDAKGQIAALVAACEAERDAPARIDITCDEERGGAGSERLTLPDDGPWPHDGGVVLEPTALHACAEQSGHIDLVVCAAAVASDPYA